MTAADAALVANLPGWAFKFALVLSRCGAACMLMPGCAEAEVPMMVRAGFAAMLTLLLLPVLAAGLPDAPANVWLQFGNVAAELAAGLLLGWVARLLMLSLPLAGQFIAVLAGHASVLQPDSVLGPQGAAVGKLFALAAPVLILASGLYVLPLTALARSYQVIPAGVLLPAADTARTIVAAVAEVFALALRLAAPFVVAGIVWHAALAAIARLVPQVQVFFIAAPAQLLGGLVLLGLLGGGLIQVWRDYLQASLPYLPGFQAN